jgi:hypothetical protein
MIAAPKYFHQVLRVFLKPSRPVPTANRGASLVLYHSLRDRLDHRC